MSSPIVEFPAPPAYSTLAVYQDNIPCSNCGGEPIFVQVYEVEAGRWGYCVGCGEPRFIYFTRATGEAA